MDRGRLGKTVAAPACCHLFFQAVGFDISTSGGWSTSGRENPTALVVGAKEQKKAVRMAQCLTPRRTKSHHPLALQPPTRPPATLSTRCAFEWKNIYNTLILPSSARGRRTESYTGPRGATGQNVKREQVAELIGDKCCKQLKLFDTLFSHRKAHVKEAQARRTKAGRTLTSRERADVFGQLSSFGE